MSAQPQYDFTPPDDNLSLDGLDDFLSKRDERPGEWSQGSAETTYILHLLDRVVQVYELMQLTSDRLAYAQERVQALELVMRTQAEQVAVLPYFQARVLELEKKTRQQEAILAGQAEQLAVVPLYQSTILELKRENGQFQAENERLNNHWLRRLFFWVR